jgi:DNA-binding GntR family transcriptional regulator
MSAEARLLGRVSTSEALVNALKAQILQGMLPAGTRLTELSLAETHGVSRQSIRLALAELSRRRLLDVRPHKGVWVRELEAREIEDLYWMRSLLESEAVAYVAVEPTTWARLEKCVERMARLPADADWSEVIEADWSFHREAVACVGSARLRAAHDMLEGESLLSFVRCTAEDDAATVARVHRELLNVICSGDSAAAVEELRRHLESSKQTVLQNRFAGLTHSSRQRAT